MGGTGVAILKKLLILCLLSLKLIASDITLAHEIYASIFQALIPNQKAKIYTQSSIEALNLASNSYLLVNNCKNADIIVITKRIPKGDCQAKILFGTRYRHLKEPNVVGAFFWQKGRPNILFKGEVLSRYNITLPHAFEPYIEE